MREKYFLAFLLSFSCLSVRSKAQNINDTSSKDMKIYQLGEVVISESKNRDVVNSADIQKFKRHDVASSLNLLPSLALSYVGGRNESMVYLRGFDLRSVPVFIDGIPVYIPYDGYVDLARFTTADLSKIEVSKGSASVLYGANTIGGAINLVGTKPDKKLEIYSKTGLFTGKGYHADLKIGSNLGKFYFQTDFSRLNKQFIRLSEDFDTSRYETDWERDNSYRNDNKFGIKIGFTPNKTDEYSINYIYQHAEKGNPVYLGEDKTVKLRYWQWPKWDKQSLYFISKTSVAEKHYLKTRLYYDKFVNILKSYDDNTYSTQTKPSSFTSYYDDYSIGGNAEIGLQISPENILKFSGHFKNDMHRENNEGEPVRHFADNTFSLAGEYEYKLTDHIKIIPGLSYNFRNSLIAEDYNAKTNVITEFPVNKNAAAHAQMAFRYQFTENYKLNLTIARKTRFATMKDRYSYRLGTTIPNPDLKSENAINYEIASILNFKNIITVEPAVFYSDLNNTIQMVDNVLPGKSQLQNTGHSRFFGADMVLRYQVLKNLLFNAAYTFIQRENISNPQLKFTDVPKHKVFAYLDYLPVKNLEIVVSAEYNSERYSTSYGITAPEFILLNSHFSYNFAKYLKVEAGVNNVLDKNYSIREGYPEEGRNFYCSLILNITK